MVPRSIILAVLVSVFSTPAYSQDSPSLGDLARQLQSQKSTGQSKRIITNDDLPSASAVTSLGLEKPGDPANSAKLDAESSAQASLTRWESVVKKIDSMDRAALLRMALQGANSDFPGHGNWEDRLLTAKQTYVSQGLDLIHRARQLLASAQTLQNAQAKADDPRVKDLTQNLQGLARESVRSDAAFQAAILEGRDLAHQAPAH